MNDDHRWSGLRAAVSKLGRPTLAGALATLLLSPMLLSPLQASAKDTPSNLGGNLAEMAAAASRNNGSLSPQRVGAKAIELQVTTPLILDESSRPLVRVTLNGKVSVASMLASMRGMKNVAMVAWNTQYGAGVMEAYVPADQLLAVARHPGVLAVVPSAPMITNVGLTDSQGIFQHRVNRIPGVDGSGITIGVISDSYDTSGVGSGPADVASGDLPGAGNPLGNTQAVVVLQDQPAGTDEGRAMLQIVHDMAPKARLGFATASFGEVNLANNIRALAGFPDAANVQPGFKADIIVDDVLYPTEPMFQDGIVAQAADAAAAAGVAFFSSAGNRAATQAYDSKPRIVPATAASIAGSNLDFTEVDPALFAGGFHDFNADKDAVDISQTITFAPNNRLVFQWNEPYDPQPPRRVGAPLVSTVGTVVASSKTDVTFNGTAGQTVEIFVDADNTTTGIPNRDLTLALFDPAGTLLQTQDATTNPESLVIELPVTGTYRVAVGSFELDQSGDFKLLVQQVEFIEQVLTDFNLLFFLPDGTFIGAVAEENRSTNRPLEFAVLPPTTLQMVIARANTPNSRNRNVADRFRYVGFNGVSPQEYFSYLNPVTYGHNSAQGAMGVAAYAFFAPFVPEGFTSPGPSTIYFDTNNRRLRNVQIRQKPDLAAMDGANTTFFGNDSAVDADAFPNFFGTSAAAPHAAAIAALVLDAAGGPGQIKPDRMRKILQDSAFRHDLDPYFSSGFALSAAGSFLAINATADPNAISQFDPNVFTLTQVGLGRLQSLSLNGVGANPTQSPGGIVFDQRATPLPAPGQPFVIGRTVGLSPTDVTASLSLPADLPGLAGQFKQLDLSFATGSFRSGDLLAFGIDRDETDVAGPGGAAGGNSADLLGGGVLIPSGELVRGGARFFGTFEGGARFNGEFFNLIGNGYSQLDGYGFINAEAAVKAVSRRGRK